MNWRFFAMLVLAMPAAFAPAASAQTFDGRIEHEGRRHGSVEFERRSTRDGIQTRETARIAIATGSAREWMNFETRSAESSDGKPLRQSLRIQAGAAPREASAQIGANGIQLLVRHGERRQQLQLPLPPQLLLDAGLQRRIAAQAPQHAWSFEYDELDLFAARVRQVRLSSDGDVRDGVLQLRQEYLGDDGTPPRIRPWSVAEAHFLPRWTIAGSEFASRTCDAACEREAIEDYPLLDTLALAAPFRIPSLARRKILRYVFESSDADAAALPATGEQRVVQRGNRSIVTVCADCGSEAQPTAGELANYRSANAWVQSDHAQLRSLARSARASGSVRGRMHKLVQLVQVHMNGDRQTMGYASALQAADSRAGDCTEFAVLLAALARANGIATRVVAGLTYSSRFTGLQHVFSPHAWVQAWDGQRWISYDAGLGDFDSTHIVLAIGDGSPQDYAGVLNRVRRLRLVDAAQIEPLARSGALHTTAAATAPAYPSSSAK